MKKIKAGIIGAASLVSGKLIELLLNHENVEITCLVSEHFTHKSIGQAHSHLKGVQGLEFEPYDLDQIEKKCDLVFSAKPHGESMEKIPELLKLGIKVIDISADFRIKNPKVFSEWYKVDHAAPEILKKAVYGLPELYFEKIKNAQLIANPGCYPTSVILGLAPLISLSLVNTDDVIIVDSVSGISGAGRSLSSNTQFINISDNIRPYNVGTHRHTPEMEQELSLMAGNKSIRVLFAPNVGPFNFGIASNIFLNLKNNKTAEKDLFAAYTDYYKDKPFVRICKPDTIPEIKDVVNTNFCDIGVCFDKRLKCCVVFSVIDNIIKGAAGQAVQNMNIMSGLDEKEGLPYKHALNKKKKPTEIETCAC